MNRIGDEHTNCEIMNVKRTSIAFYQIKFGRNPLSIVVLWIQVVGFDPRIARANDFMMSIIHLGFQMRVATWLMTLQDGWKWVLLCTSNYAHFYFTFQWSYVELEQQCVINENHKAICRIENVWILLANDCLKNQHIFINQTKDRLHERNKGVKVEFNKQEAQLLCWKL